MSYCKVRGCGGIMLECVGTGELIRDGEGFPVRDLPAGELFLQCARCERIERMMCDGCGDGAPVERVRATFCADSSLGTSFALCKACRLRCGDCGGRMESDTLGVACARALRIEAAKEVERGRQQFED